MESFLQKYRCSKASEATHLSLVGGKFNIPTLDLFHGMYFKMLSYYPVYLVEKVRYPCRWYIDLDKQDPKQLMHLLKELLRKHGERCVVSMPESCDGAHLVFPEIIVHSKEEAVRKTRALMRDIPFDASVYRSGLRMIGSQKSKTVDRAYWPVFGISKGQLYDIHTWTLEHLKDSSIFHNNKIPVVMDSLTEPVYCYEPSALTETGNFGFIHPEYTNVRFQVKASKNYMNVLTNSTYCTNIQRKHKSNHVYFVIYQHPTTKVVEVYAKCFCTCAHTGCKDYKSPILRMPLLLYFRLKQMCLN